MSTRKPWFAFYVNDFMGDELVRLGHNQLVGVYIRLLCHQWSEGSLPSSERALAIIASEPLTTFRRIWRELRVKFQEKDGRLFNPRMLEEQVRAEQKSRLLGNAARSGTGGEQRFLYAVAANCYDGRYDNVDHRCIKIGWSRNPERRLSSITHPKLRHVDEKKLLGTVPASLALERRAHIELAAHLDAGEWFKDCRPVRDWLKLHGVTAGNTTGHTDGKPTVSTPRGYRGKPALQSQSESEPQSEPTKPSRGFARATWLSPFAAVWTARYGGAPGFGVLAKHLSPLVDTNGSPMVLEHWTRYVAATDAPYASPARFAQTFGAWGAGVAGGAGPGGVSQHEAIRRAQAAGLRVVPTVPPTGFPNEAVFNHWLERAKETAA